MRCAIDANRFDRLAKSLSSVAARRRVLQLLATLPFVGGLATLVDEDKDDADAKGRRKRRKKRHKHRTGKRKDNRTGKSKGKHKKQPLPGCTPATPAQTCAGRCGSVTNNCQQAVDCGPCACDPPCGACQSCSDTFVCEACAPCCNGVCCDQPTAICHAGSGGCCVPDSHAQTCDGQCGDVLNTCGVSEDCGPCLCAAPCPACQICDEVTGDCVADSDEQGDLCGAASCADGVFTPRSSCNGSGSCVPGTPVSCDPYTRCDGDACATTCASTDGCRGGYFCALDSHCAAVVPDGQPCGTGEQCASGFCADGVCCNTACAGDCEACNLSGTVGACTTVVDGSACGSGDICCADGCVNPRTDAQNCGTCGEACRANQSCQGGMCGEVCGSGFCAAPDEICCNEACCDGCCGADGSCGACLVFVTSNVSEANLGGLAGADLACQTLAELATPSALPGKYTAWLSINEHPDQSPANGRFRHSGQPYRLVNGAQIAANWADLTDGNLAAPISLTESGQGVSSSTRFVWTNTRTDGTAGGHFGVGLLSCGGWQLTSGSSGNNGDATHTGVGWTFIGHGSCNRGDIRLYCFQQR